MHPVRIASVLNVSPRRFEELVGDALDAIPPELLRLLDNVVIQVADEDPDEPALLGVYRGTALTEACRSWMLSRSHRSR